MEGAGIPRTGMSLDLEWGGFDLTGMASAEVGEQYVVRGGCKAGVAQ